MRLLIRTFLIIKKICDLVLVKPCTSHSLLHWVDYNVCLFPSCSWHAKCEAKRVNRSVIVHGWLIIHRASGRTAAILFCIDCALSAAHLFPPGVFALIFVMWCLWNFYLAPIRLLPFPHVTSFIYLCCLGCEFYQ